MCCGRRDSSSPRASVPDVYLMSVSSVYPTDQRKPRSLGIARAWRPRRSRSASPSTMSVLSSLSAESWGWAARRQRPRGPAPRVGPSPFSWRPPWFRHCCLLPWRCACHPSCLFPEGEPQTVNKLPRGANSGPRILVKSNGIRPVPISSSESRESCQRDPPRAESKRVRLVLVSSSEGWAGVSPPQSPSLALLPEAATKTAPGLSSCLLPRCPWLLERL